MSSLLGQYLHYIISNKDYRAIMILGLKEQDIFVTIFFSREICGEIFQLPAYLICGTVLSFCPPPECLPNMIPFQLSFQIKTKNDSYLSILITSFYLYIHKDINLIFNSKVQTIIVVDNFLDFFQC